MRELCEGTVTGGGGTAWGLRSASGFTLPVLFSVIFCCCTNWKEMTAATEIPGKLFQTAVRREGKVWLLLKGLVFRTLQMSE